MWTLLPLDCCIFTVEHIHCWLPMCHPDWGGVWELYTLTVINSWLFVHTLFCPDLHAALSRLLMLCSKACKDSMCYTYFELAKGVRYGHVTATNRSCDCYEQAMWLLRTGHVTATNRPCDYYEQVMWLLQQVMWLLEQVMWLLEQVMWLLQTGHVTASNRSCDH